MENRKDRVYQGFSLATYTAYFCIALSRYTSSGLLYLDLAIRFIFELSFPLSLAVGESTIFPVTGFRIIRNWWTEYGSFENKRGTSYSIAALVLMNYIYLGYLIHFYTTRRISVKPHKWFSQVMQGHIYWSCGPLFVPYISILMHYLACPTPGNCHFSALEPGETAFFIIVIALHVAFSGIYVVNVFEWSPVSPFLGAKAHHRACFAAVILKAILSITFGLVSETTTAAEGYAFVSISLVAQLVAFLIYWYEMPFYRLAMNQMVIALYAVGFMASLSVLLGMITGGSGDVICIAMLIVGGILLLPTIYVLSKWRIARIDVRPIGALKTPTEIDIKVRIGVQKLVSAIEEKDGEVDDARRAMIADIDSIFLTHAKAHRTSFKFNITWATFLYNFKYNKFFGMQKLRQISPGSPIDIFPIQTRLRFFAENSNQEEVEAGLASYEEQQRLERFAVDCMGKCISSQVRFWGTLISDDYTLEGLEYLANQITELSMSAKTSLQRIISLNPKSPFYRRLYAQYLANIANDESGSKRQLTRAVELEGEEDTTQNLTDSGNGIIIISGEKELLGVILEVNNKTCELFGVSSEDVIGRKINMAAEAFRYGPRRKSCSTHRAKDVDHVQRQCPRLIHEAFKRLHL
jgi:PAS domain-containing protein